MSASAFLAGSGEGGPALASFEVLDAFPAAIAVLNERGAVVAANKAWRRAGEASGLTLAECGPGGDYPALLERLSAAGAQAFAGVLAGVRQMLAGQAATWTTEIACTHSEVSSWYSVMLNRLEWGGGVLVVVEFSDITPRRQIEDRLRQHAALLDQAHEAIFVRDIRQDAIVYWNKGAERLFGWSATEAMGRRPVELMAIDPIVYALAERKLRERGEWSGELIKKSRSGAALDMDCRWTLLRDHAGEPQSVMSIDVDITERKALQTQLLRAQRMESLGTLAGGIAHDLNNVLAPITMAVELLGDRHRDPDSQRLIATIERSAERGAAMVRQVLRFSRGIDGQRTLINPAKAVEEVAAIMRETFPRDILLTGNLPARLWAIYGDATQLHQVLLNLCVNARDAMPSGGKLTITVENAVIDGHYASMNPEVTAGPYVVFHVADTGTGIPVEIRDKIYDMFFTTKPHGKGTGLGLSTTLAIVKAHHGFINFYTEVGRGTTFKVYIPAENARADEVVKIEDPVLPPGHGELILVVDDEEAVCDVCRRTLERHGYRAITAADGAMGIAEFARLREEVAVVITDMMMPVMDGVTLIHALRRIDERVPIVAASGLGSNSRLASAADAGIKHFLHKPYTARALLGMLDKILRAGAKA